MAKAVVKTGTKPLRARNSNLHAELERRQVEAKVRNEKCAGLSPQQRFAKLDAGNRYSGFKPLNAMKEREKLVALMRPVETGTKSVSKKAPARQARV